jgi:hypothetical protein
MENASPLTKCSRISSLNVQSWVYGIAVIHVGMQIYPGPISKINISKEANASRRRNEQTYMQAQVHRKKARLMIDKLVTEHRKYIFVYISTNGQT